MGVDTFLPPKRFRAYWLPCLFLLALCGCRSTIVYQDKFDSTPIGNPPGPAQTGASSVSGDVRIAGNPANDISADRWLELERVSPTGTLAEYVATFEAPVTTGGSVALVGYIPDFAPVAMSIHFETPAPAPAAQLLHIDLGADGKIRVNDSSVEGTYEFDTAIAIVVGFKLGATPPIATILVRGGGDDASADVAIPSSVAGLGLGRVRVLTPFEGVASPQGRFFINDVVALRGSG